MDLYAAVAQTLEQAMIPDHHAFAAIVDVNGAHVAYANRIGDGWDIDLVGGYAWAGTAPGASVQFTIAKSF